MYMPRKVVDNVQFNHILALDSEKDKEFSIRTVAMFLKHSRVILNNIKGHLAYSYTSKDPFKEMLDISNAAHSLAGSAAALGLSQVVHTCSNSFSISIHAGAWSAGSRFLELSQLS